MTPEVLYILYSQHVFTSLKFQHVVKILTFVTNSKFVTCKSKKTITL